MPERILATALVAMAGAFAFYLVLSLLGLIPMAAPEPNPAKAFRCMMELAEGDSTIPVPLAADICWPLNTDRPRWLRGPA